METYWCLSKYSFQYKWNEAWLLIINWYIRVASRVVERLKTYDLRKLGNIRKISELHRILPSAQFSRNENFVSTNKNLLKNRNWTFPAVHYFTWKLEVVPNIWWMSVDSTCPFPQLQKELNKSLKLSLNAFT